MCVAPLSVFILSPFQILKKMIPSIQRILLLVVAILFFASCEDKIRSSIPDYPVSLNLKLAGEYNTFNSPNLYKVFETRQFETDFVGYGGILVYIGFDNEYYAFDMCCPYELKSTIKVRPNDLGQAICDSCKSVYDIGYGVGNPSSGKSKEALKRYKANISGNILRITR